MQGIHKNPIQAVFDDIFKEFNDKHLKIADPIMKGGCASHDEYKYACGELASYLDCHKIVMNCLRENGLVTDVPQSTVGNIQEKDINPQPQSEQTVIEPEAAVN